HDSDAGSSGERPFSHPPTLVSRRMTNQAFTENPAFSSHTRNPIESETTNDAACSWRRAMRRNRPVSARDVFVEIQEYCEKKERGSVGAWTQEPYKTEFFEIFRNAYANGCTGA
ncbi:MAG TPA: hypothetical protein VMV10_28590, partial [Pirellulales bacterium]|nr:hypothetical protein [Pirellulales bacterium]